MKKKEKCSVEECEKSAIARGLCDKHYQRYRKYGDPNITLAGWNKNKGDGWIDEKGYRRIRRDGKSGVFEHRWVYEQFYGIKLLPNENIHHKNGNRADNRIENLQLWVCHQPEGQLPEDLIRYAKEILEKYDINLRGYYDLEGQ